MSQTEISQKEKPLIRISVRHLVEFLEKEGDLDNRQGSVDMDAMQLGAKIHRKIQKSMGSHYTPEVSLKETFSFDAFELSLEGRADGIFTEDGEIWVDEIKGISKDIASIEAPAHEHLSQAKCYAYIYGRQNEYEKIGVQMTYCQMETEEIRRFTEMYAFQELEDWMKGLLKRYEKWALFRIDHEEERNESIKGLEFPYDYREGQRDVAVSVYRSIAQEKRLFIQAPTGVGKTMATLFPAVKATGEGKGEKIFYLTAKTVTRTVATSAATLLMEQGLRYKTIALTAKEKICLMEECECNPDHCPYAKGHFDRINDAVYDGITTLEVVSREVLEEHAKKWKVCPFELGLDISLWFDLIVCDYNYVFDPNAHLKRFFGEGVSGDYIFLIDEAHNLVERARSMYSSELVKEDVLKIRRKVKDDVKLYRVLDGCNKKLLSLRKECEDYQVLPNANDLYLTVTKLLLEMDRYLEDHRNEKIEDEILEFYFNIRNFLYIYEHLDEDYLIYSEVLKEGSFKVHLFCVNPARMLESYLSKGRATIFFSATFLPIYYYKELLNQDKEAYAIYVNSPFDRSKRLLLQGMDVSTKYSKRGPAMYRKYAQYIIQVAASYAGNYLAFFPSYQFMNAVCEEFKELVSDEVEYALQSSFMSEESREIFLENFEEVRENSFIGFCVMGGIFSEGIDLVEDKLVGAIVIGTGIPQIGRERGLLQEYFDQNGRRGFDYAYLYPGMNKVQQSAGRVIRTEADRGVILLLDERFGRREYQEIFPREWQDIKPCRLEDVTKQLEEFWEGETS
ncbi:PD-(D/E)XK nuclease family protein [Lachnospiraceae bacterium OttesenSCG-928-J05]|nr:PD-(D/E)XK nuclease family protein [Lachnospiraceae bacterium OttesenSCG-928-J05]